MKCTHENDEFHAIGLIETIVSIFYHNNSDDNADPFELSESGTLEELGELVEAKQIEDRPRKRFEYLELSYRSFKPPKPPKEESPTLELKPLFLHLKYAYLGDNNALPVVISTELTPE